LGIILFGFIVLGIPLLLAVLPTALLLFARGVRPLPKLLWVLLSLLIMAAMVSLDRYHQTVPTLFFLVPAWAVYFVFLWFGRELPANVRQGRRRVGLGLATAVFVCLVVWGGVKFRAELADEASTHEVFWPLESGEGHYLRLRLPAHYVGNWLQSADSVSAAKAVGIPNREGEISTRLLWPTLAPRDYGNEAEFEGLAPHVLSVHFHVLNRVSFEGRSVNRLACDFEVATQDLGKDCLVVLPLFAGSKPLATLAPRYGLARRGLEGPLKAGGPFSDDVWFVLADDGAVGTMIECPREGEASIYANCKQKFEVKPFNALVEVEYNRAYLPQWKDIQVALTNILLAMRS
jgi:hypothetical protein